MEIRRIKGVYIAINVFLLIILSSVIVGVFITPSTDTNLYESGSSPCQVLAGDNSVINIEQKEEIAQPRLTHWYGSIYPESTIEVTAFTEHTMQMLAFGNDTLRFNMRFKPKQNAHYSGTAYLYKGGSQVGGFASWNGETTANVETVALFDFCGYAINEAGFEGPYDIYLTFYKNNGTSYTIYDNEIILVTEAYKVDDFLPYPITVNEASIGFDFLDRDSNSKYEWIYAKIPVTVTMPATYYFEGRINPSTVGGVSDNSYNSTYLSVGTHTVNLRFPGWKFADMSGSDPLELDWLYIRHDDPPNYELYSNSDVYMTNIYDPSDFDVPPVVPTGQFWDDLIDSDNDGFYDYYQVKMEVDVQRIESGWWQMNAALYIYSANTHITTDWANNIYFQDVNLGKRNITFDFNGVHIYQSGISNDNFLLTDINGEYDEYGYCDDYCSFSLEWVSDNMYNYDIFEGPGAYLTHNFNDYCEDTDDDDLFNWLVIEVEVVVTKAGNYYIGTWLDIVSNYWNIDHSSTSSYLEAGTHWFTLQFEGDKFFRSGLNGLFKFENLELTGGDPWANLDNNNTATFGPYVFTDFDPPKATLTGIYSDKVKDTNSNGLWDELQIIVEVEINETGRYQMRGRLRNPITQESYYSTETKQIWNIGTEQFILAFPGEWIFSQQTTTTYTLEYVEMCEVDQNDNYIKQWDYREDNFVTDLVYDSNDFERPPGYFTGNHFDSGVDTDADGKYNYIELKIEVEINTPGNYHVYGQVYSTEGEYSISVSFDWIWLGIGHYNFTYQIDRYWVFNQPDGETFYLSYKYLYKEDKYDEYQCDYSGEAYYFSNIYHHDDFDPPGISLTGNFYDYGVDDDSNGKYDYLELAIEVSVTEPGQYCVWGYIYADEDGDGQSDGEEYDFEYETDLTVGFHNYTFKISDWWIRCYESEAQIYIDYFNVRQWIDGEGWYDRIHEEDTHFFSRTYAHTEFDDPAVSLTGNIYDKGVDTDGNGKFDYIEIKIEIEVTEAAEYFASGNIYSTTSDHGYYFSIGWSYFAVGTHNLIIQLDSRYIFGRPAGTLYYINYLSIETHDENWNVELVLKEEDDLYLPGTYTNADVDYPDAWITRIFDYGVDLDDDGFFDILRIDFEVNVTVHGIDIAIEAELSQIWDDQEVYLYDLSIGLYNVSLDFLGKPLYDSGFTNSGDLYINYYRLIRTDNYWITIYETWDDVYLRNNYRYDDFDSEYTTFIEILSVYQPDGNGQYYMDEELKLVVTILKESTEGVDRVLVIFNRDYGEYWMNQVFSNETHEIWQIDIHLWHSGDYNLVIESWGTWVSFDSVELAISIASERGLPIIHSFYANSSHCEVTEAIKFSAVVSDDDGINYVTLHVKRDNVLLTYVEDVTDGELWETIVTFDKTGSYTADITVTDMRGQTSDSGRLTINVNEWDPIISVEILPGTEIEVGTEITFTMVLRKGDAIITSVVVEVQYFGSYTLEKTEEDETTETYSFDYAVTRTGEFLCTMTILNTRNQIAVYEQVITVIGDPDANVTPGFEWFMILGLFTLLPVVRNRLKK